MYGLPDGFDCSIFSGRQLVRVCLGLHQIQLDFEPSMTLSMECEFEVTLSGDSARFQPQSYGEASIELYRLLGKTIVSAESGIDGRLQLVFSESCTLVVMDSNANAESYEVLVNGSQIALV